MESTKSHQDVETSNEFENAFEAAERAAHRVPGYLKGRAHSLTASLRQLSAYAGTKAQPPVGTGKPFACPTHAKPVGDFSFFPDMYASFNKWPVVDYILNRDRKTNRLIEETDGFMRGEHLIKWLIFIFDRGYNYGYGAAYTEVLESMENDLKEAEEKAANAYKKGFREGVKALNDGLTKGQYGSY